MGTKVESLPPQVEEKKAKGSSYIRELKEELKKVTWTTREELAFCTKIVVGSIFVFGIGIYLADLMIKGFLNGFAALVHLIFG
jgi:preprotein translocase subunit SecE